MYHGRVLGDSQRAEAAVGELNDLLMDNGAILVLVDGLPQNNLQSPCHFSRHTKDCDPASSDIAPYDLHNVLELCEVGT